MSYISYDIEAMNKVAAIASATGASPAAIGWGLPQLWLHCFRSRDTMVSDRHLLGFFGKAHDLAETLEAFGFLERSDEGWRVRGAERYLRISEARRNAGKKGRAAQMAKEGSAGRPRASARQVPEQVGTSAQQVPGKCPASAEQPSDKRRKNDVLPGQKRALSPSTLSPKGERERANGAAVGAPSQPDPPPDGGRAEGAEVQRPRPPRYGTAEYAEAEAGGDWQLLAWAPYPGESDEECAARGAENSRLQAAEREAEREAERRAWHAARAVPT